jgi:mono/diheme cytochrome c family protein
MRSSRIFKLVFLALVLLIAVGGALSWRPSIAPVLADEGLRADKQTIAHGAALAAIGNCNDCHATQVGQAFAGGRALPTPFGTIFASNITPDADTGIGSWSEAAFSRAMRTGVDREGRQLYPAFPYDHFTKATDEDIHALYAFLRSQPAVRNEIPPNKLGFPFNFRPIVAGWKLLFFHDSRFDNDPAKSEDWNRGRYLVEGLGHCGSCHTPRNVLGAEKGNSAYAGGTAEGWNAPPLNAAMVAAHKWTIDQLSEYLSTGWHRRHGAAAGPMADVARNLGQASAQDVHAIAVYIASLSESGTSNTAAAQIDHPPGNASAEVLAIYTGACANCHNGRSDVGPSKALPLSLSTAVQLPSSANAVRVVLHGIQAYRSAGGPYMPAFDGMLTDKQIAAVVDYVRARYSNHPQWTDVQEELSKARQEGN